MESRLKTTAIKVRPYTGPVLVEDCKAMIAAIKRYGTM